MQTMNIVLFVYSISVVYVATGTIVWLLNDPVEYASFTIRAHLQRYRRLPSDRLMVLSVVLLILLWPKVVKAYVMARRA